MYNVDDYANNQSYVFSNIHENVRNRLLNSKAEMCTQQHRRSSPVILKEGDSVMIRLQERNSKLSRNE